MRVPTIKLGIALTAYAAIPLVVWVHPTGHLHVLELILTVVAVAGVAALAGWFVGLRRSGTAAVLGLMVGVGVLNLTPLRYSISVWSLPVAIVVAMMLIARPQPRV